MEQINNHSPLPTLDYIEKQSDIYSSDKAPQFKLWAYVDFHEGAKWAVKQSEETISALTERVKELEELAQFVACSGADMPTIQIAARALLTPKNNGE